MRDTWIAIAVGGALCAAAGVAAVLPWALGRVGNVYAYDRYFSNGSYVRIGVRGTGWLVLAALLLVLGIPLLVAALRARRRAREPGR